MPAKSIILALHDDDRSQGGQRMLPVRTVRRFHRNDRGNMVMLLLLTVFILWTLSGLIWNTGHTVSAKIHNQTAADTAAYAASTWNARTVNLVTGLNRQVVRIASAEAVAMAMPLTTLWMMINWTYEIVSRLPPPRWPELLVVIPEIILEMIATAEFMITSLEVLPEWGNQQLLDRIKEITTMEKAAIQATPTLIKEDLQWLDEKYYPNIDIALYQPYKVADADLADLHGTDWNKVTTILPPLKEADYGGLVVPCLIQLFRDLYSKNGWYKYNNGSMGLSKAKTRGRAHIGWPMMGVVCTFIVHALKEDHYELINTSGASFWHPMPSTDDNGSIGDQQKHFSVLAVSQGKGASERYTMRGIFDRPGFGPDDISVCYAQAETFNPVASMIEDIPILREIMSIIPWQTNSTWGWQWQARMAPADTLTRYLEHTESQAEFGRFASPSGGASVDGINLH